MVRYRKQGKGRLDDPLCRWLAWFNKNSSPKLLEEVVKMDAAIQTADERFAHLIRDKDELLAYDRYMKAECDRTAEFNFALKKEKIKIARNLLIKGSTPEFIQEITGLSPEEIKKL